MASLDWNQLRIVLALARTGSVRAAGLQLGVSHSTVSRRIDTLERDLGVRLFERLPNGYVPTEAGNAVCATANRVEDELNDVERQIVGQDARLSGDVRVTLPDVLARLLMPEFVRFAQRYPEINLEVISSYQTLSLSRREADVAVRITYSPPEHLIGRQLGSFARAIYATPAYVAERALDGSDPRAFWIGWDDGDAHPQWVRASALPRLPVRHRLNDVMLQLEAVRGGLGVAMLPCFIGDVEPGLVRVPPGEPLAGHPIWLLTHPDLRHTARIRLFTAAIARAVASRRALIDGLEPRAPAAAGV